MNEVLPKFISLNETVSEWHIPLPPVMSWAARNNDSPIDRVQAVAIYHYRRKRSDNTTVYELEGVEITDTRLDTARAELEALRARLTLTEQALMAAGELISILPETYGEHNSRYMMDDMKCVVCHAYINCIDGAINEPHEPGCGLEKAKQAYTRARERLAEGAG